ncbi:MAG: M24 family metallopeptidase [Limisphaerales bacterium]
MKCTSITTARVALPSFGRPSTCPDIPAELYRTRLASTAEHLRAGKLDTLVVYADREHCANLAYLTGFDPRFEEALLLLSSEGRRKLLVGNECLGYLPDTQALGLDVELFQEFSLMGQPRNASRPLKQILRDFGIDHAQRVGCAGWKHFDDKLLPGGPLALDVPAYLADLLRELTGDSKRVLNANGLFMDVRDGLRVINEPAQIAQFEYASCVTSEGVLSLLRHLRPGRTERELEKYLDTRGLPLSCHRMVSFGEKARRGLSSPTDQRAKRGDPYTVGFGVQGALTSRAGMVAAGPGDLAGALREFYLPLATNYFHVVATWYESVRVGASAGAVVRAVEGVRDGKLYRFAVNPGHYLHLDEWLHSPFSAGSRVRLRSGMALQMDIIPVSAGPFCYINGEDGIVLADARLRGQLAQGFPELWKRVQARRAFMRDALGIDIDESVLPLGNIPGWLPPWALDLDKVFIGKEG